MATGTVVDVVMPQMGVSVSEGTVSRWLKAVGDRVEADETIVEISTDKVDTEVPSPASGIVAEMLVRRGRDGAGRDAHRRHRPGDGPGPAPQRRARLRRPGARGRGAARRHGAPAERDDSARRPGPQHEANGDNGDDGGDQSVRTVMSPVVARMAEHGLDIAAIPGTGRGGRVTKKDVEAFLGPAAPTPTPVARRAARPRRPARAPAPAAPARPRAGSGPAPAPHVPVGGRGGLPVQHDPQGHRAPHAPLARHGGARHHRDRGRHDRRRRAARSSRSTRNLRREAHLHAVHHARRRSTPSPAGRG